MNTVLDRLKAWNTGMNDIPRRVLIIMIVAVVCYCAVVLFPLFSPFVIALIFASIFEPVARLLRKALKRLKAARVIATLLCMVLLFGLITAGVIYISDRLVREGINLLRATPDLARTLYNALTSLVSRIYEEYREVLPETFVTTVNSSLSNLLSNVISFAGTLSTRIASFTINTVTWLPRAILAISFTIISTFYFSYDRERIANFFRNAFPHHVTEHFRLIRKGVFTAVFGEVRAQIFISFVLMLIIIAGLYIIQRPYALLLGVLIGVADVLPVIGAGLFLNTWAIGELVVGDTFGAVGLFVIYLVTVVARQMIEPRVVGEQLGLYPLVTMISMYAGYKIMGTLGLIAGPLIANLCRVVLDADAGKLVIERKSTPIIALFKRTKKDIDTKREDRKTNPPTKKKKK